jgi:hypothetical protein
MFGLVVSLLVIGASALPAAAHGQPGPQAPPQAQGRPVTVLPACPAIGVTRPTYVEEFQDGQVICAGMQRPRRKETVWEIKWLTW